MRAPTAAGPCAAVVAGTAPAKPLAAPPNDPLIAASRSSTASSLTAETPDPAKRGKVVLERLPKPAFDKPEGDEDGGELVEGLEGVGPPLVADREPPEAHEPGERAFDHPPVAAQALAALDAAPCDARDDTPAATGAAAAVVVVPFVRVQLPRSLAWAAGALPDRRHRVQHRRQHDAVMDVRGREGNSERDAVGVHEDVPLAARLAAVGRVRAGELAPPPPLWPAPPPPRRRPRSRGLPPPR